MNKVAQRIGFASTAVNLLRKIKLYQSISNTRKRPILSSIVNQLS